MTSIGYATLQIIPSLRGVTDEINKQIEGKKVSVTLEPKVDERAAEAAGKKTKESVEKQTAEVKVTPKVDQQATDKAGKDAGGAFGGAFSGVMKGVGDRAGAIFGKALAGNVDGAVKDVTSALDSVSGGLSKLQDLAGSESFVGQGIGRLKGVVDGARSSVETLTGTFSSVASGVQMAQTTFQGLSSVVRLATGSQIGLNVALLANPIGIVVAAIAGLVTGLVLFFTKTETGRKVWEKFSEVVGKAWDWVKGKAETAWKWFESNLWPGIKTGVETASKVFVSLRDTVGKVFGRIKEFIQPVLDMILKIKDVVGGVASSIGGFVGRFFGGGGGSDDGPPINIGGGLGDNIREVLTDDSPFSEYNIGGGLGDAIRDAKKRDKQNREDEREAKASERAERQAQREADKEQARGLTPHAKSVQRMIKEIWPEITTIGGYRDPDGKFNEHSTGNALDVMIPNWNTPQGKALGDQITKWAMQNADDLGLSWALWRQTQYGGSAGPGGSGMPDRGNPTENHMDHVHLFMDRGKSGRSPASPSRQGVSSAAGESLSAVGPFGGPPSMDGFYAWVVPMKGDGAAAAGGPAGLGGGGAGGLTGLGSGIGATTSGSDLSLITDAAESAVSGQVSSALGVFGAGTPGWLQAAGNLVGGISVSGPDGKKIFGGGSAGGVVSGVGSMFGGSQQSAAPLAAASAMSPSPAGVGAVHGSAGGQRPGPAGATYNIRTATVEDAFLEAQRRENEAHAAKLSRF